MCSFDWRCIRPLCHACEVSDHPFVITVIKAGASVALAVALTASLTAFAAGTNSSGSSSGDMLLLDSLGIEELRSYIDELRTEFARVEADIGRKNNHRSAADAFFKRP